MNDTPAPLPMRAGHLPMADVIDLYMSMYAGRDTTRTHRLAWWRERVGAIRLDELSDDHVHEALEELARKPACYYSGADAAGRPVVRAKGRPLSPATVNRYHASLAAVVTWAIVNRVAPKGMIHPCRSVPQRRESPGKTRFLTVEERDRLLQACAASKWPRLKMLVLMALSTGARKGELMGLRWSDVDLAQRVAHVARTKNNDPKTLPLIPSVVEAMQGMDRPLAGLVFASSRLPSNPYCFEERWRQALRAARLRGVCFHTLRHSCASFLAQEGVSLVAVADLLGHRHIATTRRYAHLANQHRAEVVNRVLGDLR